MRFTVQRQPYAWSLVTTAEMNARGSVRGTQSDAIMNSEVRVQVLPGRCTSHTAVQVSTWTLCSAVSQEHSAWCK